MDAHRVRTVVDVEVHILAIALCEPLAWRWYLRMFGRWSEIDCRIYRILEVTRGQRQIWSEERESYHYILKDV